MSLELQVRSSIMEEIIRRTVQMHLRSTCFTPIGLLYIDHADVASMPIRFNATAIGTIELLVPIDVFIVERDDLFAAPNQTPRGASSPRGVITLKLELASDGAKVSIRAVDLLQAPIPLPNKNIWLESTFPSVEMDYTENFKLLGISEPMSSRIDIVGTVVAIRFDPVGGAVEHLFPEQEWGLFIDGASVEDFTRSFVPSELKSRLTSFAVTPHWRPKGNLAHVDINYSGKGQVPDPFSANVNGVFDCDFALSPTLNNSLRTTVSWTLNVDLGDFVPSFIEDMVVEAIIKVINPRTFGAISLGDRRFAIDKPLPVIKLSGARLTYASVKASIEGMTIGGQVRLPVDPGKDTLQLSTDSFGLPTILFLCSQLAKTGDGKPPKTVSLSEVSTEGAIGLDNSDVFCGIEIVSPGDWITPFIFEPVQSVIRISIPSTLASSITESVRLIVLSSRGVRFVDLGIPPVAQVDTQGNVLNANIQYIDDCLTVRGEVGDYSLHRGDIEPPPLEDPNWNQFLDENEGISVQLVSLSGLESGELIQMRTRHHAVDITANHSGQAFVPVLFPLSTRPGDVKLVRVNRRSINDCFIVNSTAFIRQLSFNGGNQAQLNSTPDGKTLLTIERGDRIDVHELDKFGVSTHLDGSSIRQQNLHSATEINPQPIPPKEDTTTFGNPVLARKIELPGVLSLLTVPGFETSPIAIAVMSDQSKLILDLEKDGIPRVAGTLNGPIGFIDVSGQWGMTFDRNKVSLYKRINFR